eukprot:6835830-Lingulodinium_polyedra.AAC.1
MDFDLHCMVLPGNAWHGKTYAALRGTAWHCVAWQHMHGTAWHRMALRGMAWHDMPWPLYVPLQWHGYPNVTRPYKHNLDFKPVQQKPLLTGQC